MVSRQPAQPYDVVGFPDGQADRPGPIICEYPWDGRLSRTRAHVALVVVYNRGDGKYQVFWPHERGRVRLSSGPATTYEIDLGVHRTVVTADLPCRDYSGVFHATMNLLWRVTDPVAVVRHQVKDVKEMLSPALELRARASARIFNIDQMAPAEDEINQELGGVPIGVPATSGAAAPAATGSPPLLGAEYGLATQVITHLALDEAAAAHNAKMKKLQWAVEEEEAEQSLRRIKNRNDQEITEARTDMYRKIIAAGDGERFALQLANNPADIAAISQIIREDQITSRKDTIDFISHMVDAGVVERWEVSDQVREALRWLLDATARVVSDKEYVIGNAGDPWRRRRRGRTEPSGESAIQVSPEDVTRVKEEPLPPGGPADSTGGAEASADSGGTTAPAEPVASEGSPESSGPSSVGTDASQDSTGTDKPSQADGGDESPGN